mgnify:CR=1 FL=1
MEVKEFEGIEYIEKTQVDELIRSRLAKMSERTRTLQSEKDDLQSKLESSKGATDKLDAMASQITALQAELGESKARYQIHSQISSHGITDPDIRDMIEWQYQKAMSSSPKKDRKPIGEWLEGLKSDPSTAPATIRPHLQSTAQASSQPAPQKGRTAPQVNQGAVNPPGDLGGRDLIEKGAQDPEFYSKNRDKIREAWYRQKGIPAPYRF